jgi:hypothetical protein
MDPAFARGDESRDLSKCHSTLIMFLAVLGRGQNLRQILQLEAHHD